MHEVLQEDIKKAIENQVPYYLHLPKEFNELEEAIGIVEVQKYKKEDYIGTIHRLTLRSLS